jgi:hypothetical protein
MFPTSRWSVPAIAPLVRGTGKPTVENVSKQGAFSQP